MSALATIATRPPIRTDHAPADDGLGLLLDLFALELPAEAPAVWRRPAGGHRAALRAWVRQWLRRAALWGAGPQGAWRAW